MFDLAYTLESYDLIATEGIKDVAKGIWKKIVGVLSTLKAKLLKAAERMKESASNLFSIFKRDSGEDFEEDEDDDYEDNARALPAPPRNALPAPRSNKYANGSGKNGRSHTDSGNDDYENDDTRALPVPRNAALPAPTKSRNERRREINNFSKGKRKGISKSQQMSKQGADYRSKYVKCANLLDAKTENLESLLNKCVAFTVDALGRKTYAGRDKYDTDFMYKKSSRYENMKEDLDRGMRTSEQNDRVDEYGPKLQNSVAELKDYINNEFNPLVSEIAALPRSVAKLAGRRCLFLRNKLKSCGKRIDQLIKCVQSNPNGLYAPKMVRLINSIADAGTVILQAAAAHNMVVSKFQPKS